MTRRLLITTEVAELLRLDPMQVRYLFKKGTLKGFKVGGAIRYYADQIESFLNLDKQESKKES